MSINAISYKSDIRWLVKFLINSYFINLNSVVIVHNSKNSSDLQNEYLLGIQCALKDHSIHQTIVVHWLNNALVDKNGFYNLLLKNVELGSQGYITVLKNTEEFISAKYNATESSVVRQKDKLFLFLIENEDKDRIFNQKPLKLYPHHLVVQPDNQGDFNLWTQKFSGIKNNNEAILINKYLSKNFTFAVNTSLYPYKLKNLQGFELNISTATYVPYAFANFTATGKGNVDSIGRSDHNIWFDGTEPPILIEFCKNLNCTPKLLVYQPDNWGGIYENGSSDGLLGAVYRKEADLAVCGIFNWYSDLFDSSQIIAKAGITLLVPKPLHVSPFRIIFLPFKKFVWFFIIGTMFFSALIYFLIKIYIARNHEKNIMFEMSERYFHTNLEVASIFFQQSYTQKRFTHITARLCIASLSLAGVILENSYSGGLKSFLTVPVFLAPIDTVEKFVESGLKWGAPDMSYIISLEKSEWSHHKYLVRTFQKRDYNDLRKLSFSRKYAILLERLHGGNFAFGKYIKHDALDFLIILQEDLYFEFTRIYGVRGWPLMEELNTVIFRAVEHGLYKIWETHVTRKYLDSKTENALINLANGNTEKTPPEAIKMYQLWGFSPILIIGYTFAIIILMIENVIFNSSKKNKNKCKN